MLIRDGTTLDEQGRILIPGPCLVRIPGVCTGWAQAVHHTRDRLIVGDDPAYLVASCRRCNNHIGDPTTSSHTATPSRARIHIDPHTL